MNYEYQGDSLNLDILLCENGDTNSPIDLSELSDVVGEILNEKTRKMLARFSMTERTGFIHATVEDPASGILKVAIPAETTSKALPEPYLIEIKYFPKTGGSKTETGVFNHFLPTNLKDVTAP